MRPIMTDNEIVLLSGFYATARSYLEFGAGGSTVLAAGLVADRIVSLDSDQAWLGRVEAACLAADTRLQPQTRLIDIGPTGEWGYPTDEARRPSWPAYHERIWTDPQAGHADLYMVDGRFRVACFLQVLLRAAPDAIILIHDYESRPHYHVVARFSRPLCRVDDLAAFQRAADCDHAGAVQALRDHRFDPR